MGVRSTNEGNFVSQISSQPTVPNLFSSVGPNEAAASPYDATGGTKSTPGDGYVYHVFTSSGSWQVNAVGGAVEYVLIAGGGGGGWDRGGGGGAGAYVPATIPQVVVEGAGTGTFAVTIGAGGAGATNDPTTRSGADGSNSTWAYVLPTAPTGLLAKGGGGGGGNPQTTHGTGRSSADPFGGSGGGGEGTPNDNPGGAGGSYGNPGFKQGPPYDSGGGGGAGTGGPPSTHNKDGGDGLQNPWALPTWGVSPPGQPANVRMFAGGGGGTTLTTGPTITPGAGGPGGGGYGGGPNPAHPPNVGGDGTTNTGSGGGGGSGSGDASGDGGPGILMIRYQSS